MKNIVSGIEERQFITKEFADTLACKTPAPYLRVHDRAQQALVALGQYDSSTRERQTGLRPYLDRMIHFWREISLAGLPCAGKAMDECYALLFESTFTLAQSDPVWTVVCSATQSREDVHVNALRHLAQQVKAATIAHSDLVDAFTHLYAPRREQAAFDQYLETTSFNSRQIEFINLIIDYLTQNGVMEPELLFSFN